MQGHWSTAQYYGAIPLYTSLGIGPRDLSQRVHFTVEEFCFVILGPGLEAPNLWSGKGRSRTSKQECRIDVALELSCQDLRRKLNRVSEYFWNCSVEAGAIKRNRNWLDKSPIRVVMASSVQ